MNFPGNRCGVAAALTMMALTAPVAAQTYPSKPIRLIVSIAAGSVTDVIMRAAANEPSPSEGAEAAEGSCEMSPRGS